MADCDCHSYNARTGSTPEVILVEPSTGRKRSIDACMAPLIARLWDAGVGTLGCCCGHGTRAAAVLLSDVGDRNQAMQIASETYGREVRIEVWTLSLVGVARPVAEEEAGALHSFADAIERGDHVGGERG